MTVIGDPRKAGESGPAGDQRKAGEEGVAGDPRPAGQKSAPKSDDTTSESKSKRSTKKN